MPRLELEIDEDDYASIQEAMARWQTVGRVNGQLMLGDGDGDLGGRILGVICRSWLDANALTGEENECD